METSKSSQFTLKMRVWATVRNNPGLNSAQIVEKLPGELRSSISSALSVLEYGEIIYSTGAGWKGNPKKYFSLVEKFKTNNPPTRKVEPISVGAPAILSTPDPVVVPREYVDTPVKTVDRIEEIFDTFSLNECREIYRRLNDLFGR